MQILTVLSQACDQARKKFCREEQLMFIDIFNGTALTAGILGQHLTAQVEDSFNLYPGIYEEKWGTSKKDMLDKIMSLDRYEAALVELWAVGFWALSKEDALESYIAGRINISIRVTDAIARLHTAGDQLEKTKSAFKSASIADCRKTIQEAAEILSGML